MPVKYDDRNLGKDTKIRINGEYTGNLYSIGDTRASRKVIDITPYGADNTEYAVGVNDSGTLEIELSESAVKSAVLHDAYYSSKVLDVIVEFPSGAYMQSLALVSSYGKSVKRDDVVRTHATLQLTGAPKFGDMVVIMGPVTVDRGSGVKLTANGPVVWSIVSPTTDPTTAISTGGYLVYGRNETADGIVVQAVSPSGDAQLHAISATHEPLRVMPERLEMSPGETRELAATQPVRTWIIEGDHHADTGMDGNTLRIASGETSMGLWIRCESVYDESAFAFVHILSS